MTVPRRLALLVASACAVGVAGPAFAGPDIDGSPTATEVSLSTPAPGSRQLSVLDLAGQPLTNLPLRAGVPQPFRVRVQDTGVGQLTTTVDGAVVTNASTGFTVTATMNNLYAGGSPSATDVIPASDIAVGFPTGGAKKALADVTVLPRTVLSGTIAGCASLLALPALSGLSALSGAGLDLCNAVGTGVTLAPLEVTSDTAQQVADLVDVPFALAGQEAGAFTLADYINGIGGDDTRGDGAGTGRTLLTGTPGVTAALTAALNTALAPLAAQPATSATGANAQTAVADVMGKLATVPSLASLYTALSSLTPTQIAAVLSSLNAALQPITLADITGVTGTYESFPILTASPSQPTAGGTYKGTMTVTLVQP